MKAGSKKTKQGANLGSSFLMLSSSKFINYGIGLVSAMLLARFRTLEEYGTYAQILMIINLVTSILLLGLPNSLNYFLARAETAEEKNHFLSLYYSVNTILSIMVGGILVAVTPLLARIFNNPLLESFLYFIAVYPWVKIVTSSVENLLVVFQKNRLIIAYRLAHSILVVLAILFVQVMGLTFRDYIAIFLGIEALFTALTYLLANLLGGRLRFSLDRKLLRAVLIFSIPLGLSTACGTLRHEMDKFFIGLVTNTEKVALYTQAAKEMPVTMISASLTAVLLPHIARLQREKKTREALTIWHDATILSMIINGFFAIGLLVFCREAVLLLYSEKYAEATGIFAIYSLTYIIRSTYFGMILNTGGNTKLILNSSLISLTINAVLNVVLYYLIGFTGPAVATVLSTIGGAFYLLYHTSRVTGVPYREVFPWKQCGKILAVNLVLGAFFLGVKLLLPIRGKAAEIILAIVLALIWLALLFRIFRKTIREKWKTLKGKERNEPVLPHPEEETIDE